MLSGDGTGGGGRTHTNPFALHETSGFRAKATVLTRLRARPVLRRRLSEAWGLCFLVRSPGHCKDRGSCCHHPASPQLGAAWQGAPEPAVETELPGDSRMSRMSHTRPIWPKATAEESSACAGSAPGCRTPWKSVPSTPAPVPQLASAQEFSVHGGRMPQWELPRDAPKVLQRTCS